MTRTNHSTEVYLYYCRHFGLENKGAGVVKGYEPNPTLYWVFLGLWCHGKGTVSSFENLS